MSRRLKIVNSGTLYANPYQGDWARHGYHPRILEIAPNELLCVYRRGAAMYADDGRSFQLRSTDNGNTWDEEGCVWDGAADEKSYHYSATSLSQMADGEIILTGFRIHRPQPDMLFYKLESASPNRPFCIARPTPAIPGQPLRLLTSQEDGCWR